MFIGNRILRFLRHGPKLSQRVMFESFTFWLVVLALLVAYLFVSVERRHRAEDAREREERARRVAGIGHLAGASFDVSAIAPRIGRLRQDHLAAPHSPPCHAFYRRGLLAAVREMVASLSYFLRAGAEREMRKYEA
jgi:hypothetical protein